LRALKIVLIGRFFTSKTFSNVKYCADWSRKKMNVRKNFAQVKIDKSERGLGFGLDLFA